MVQKSKVGKIKKIFSKKISKINRAKYRQMKKNHEAAMKIARGIPQILDPSITPDPQPPQINSANIVPLIYSTQKIKNENNNRNESPPPAEPTIVKKESIKCENNEQKNVKVESNILANHPTSQYFARSQHHFLPDFGKN